MTTKFRVLCPCQCGQSVEARDEGFEATTVEVDACDRRKADEPSVVSFRVRKSAPLESAPYRDTRGMDRFYGGKEPPFEVNDDFARTGSIGDY